MKRIIPYLLFVVLCGQFTPACAQDYAREPRFRALVYWEPGAEEAHVQFDKQAMEFLHKLTYGEGWIMDRTTSLALLYRPLVMLAWMNSSKWGPSATDVVFISKQ